MTDENASGDVGDVEDSLQSMKIKGESLDDPSNGQDSTKKTDKQKVDILLKPTGNAPIMKKKKWTVDSDKKDRMDSRFLYVNQTFAPSPDQLVKNLYDCYSTEGKLVLHYCKTQAWG
ncbi:hypothetical protein NQ315_007744 [Exocentrus adspersus]|uniref:Ubiquitin-like protein ATG12 n=1 Tax=Exocentrus adspersus TaxID=1586481 RepID=A0AAV8W8K1_9CUCU|nr:hypothetical protein NQ315_007744 [Exocentrus adspersus]